MASLTKLQARTLVQELIDDPAAALWSAANLDRVIELSLDELWSELLDTFPYLRSTEQSVTPTAPGIVSLGWTDGSGQLSSRFVRLHNVVRDSKVYAPCDPKDVVVENGVLISGGANTYVIMGEELHLFPYAVTAVRVRYSSRPVGFTTLADGTAVEWMDGHEWAYIYDAAARALEKGDRENSERFAKRAEQALFKLKALLRKQSHGPTMPWIHQDGREWGGV
jgi:hypothetical protein